MSHDCADFERLLDELGARADAKKGLSERVSFDRSRPLIVARAPGRLDVMGGFADYSGSLALELPTREAAFVAVQEVAVQEVAEPVVRVQSSSLGPKAPPDRHATFPLRELREQTQTYAAARAYFHRQPAVAWAAYVAGVLAALRIELGQEVRAGLDILVASSVPEGKGVSSSAAIEVATLHALAALYGIDVPPARAAIYCQRVENLVVGAPCGVMDQMTSSSGHEGKLLPLLCQPAEVLPSFAIPGDLAIWGIDSGLRHQVSGADYTQVRVAAFMGYAIIARALGFPTLPGPEPGRVLIRDEAYRGYLANITPESFEKEHEKSLPERISGAEFLREFAGINDPITRVEPNVTYRVRAATAHPIYEHQRASEYRALMESGRGQAVGERLGELMYEAHESYSACGLGSPGTDRIVLLVRELGHTSGLYGAKITGGGSGGTVAVLGRAMARPAVDSVMSTYAKETGHQPHLFWGSSPGAAAFGTARARFEGGGWHLERVSAEAVEATRGAS
jgi:L-arabinokinase